MKKPNVLPIQLAESEAAVLRAARQELECAAVCDIARAPCLFKPESLGTVPELLLFVVGVLDAANTRGPDPCLDALCEFSVAVIERLRELRKESGAPRLTLPAPLTGVTGIIGPACPRKLEKTRLA